MIEKPVSAKALMLLEGFPEEFIQDLMIVQAVSPSVKDMILNWASSTGYDRIEAAVDLQEIVLEFQWGKKSDKPAPEDMAAHLEKVLKFKKDLRKQIGMPLTRLSEETGVLVYFWEDFFANAKEPGKGALKRLRRVLEFEPEFDP